MTDDQLRLIVREAIARHMSGGAAPARPPAVPHGPGSVGTGTRAMPAPSWAPAPAAWFPPGHQQPADASPSPSVVIANAPGGMAIAAGPGATVQVHISHAAFALAPASDDGRDGPCANEPGASCNQCGFCQSFGH
jgi:hypothetical protein